MKLVSLHAERFRSLRDVTINELGSLTVYIGANASGKSTLLDALRFLAEGLRDGDFADAVTNRGSMTQVCWKGSPAATFALSATFEEKARTFVWSLRLGREGFGFVVEEESLRELDEDGLRIRLESKRGDAWYWSKQAKTDRNQQPMVKLTLPTTACALTRAAEDASFPGCDVAQYVRGWAFFDPSPERLKYPSNARGDWLDPLGGNLGPRLYALQETDHSRLERIVAATRDVLGVPHSIEARQDDDGRVYLVEREEQLAYPVRQQSVSSGTLRVLAFMTALLGDDEIRLVGIEEPENYVHPSALRAFATHLRDATARKQILVTTHSPLVLDCLPQPSEVRVVVRTAHGTVVERVPDPDAIDKALEESGFGLGEFFETRGFGA